MTQTNAIETIFFYNCFIPAPLLMVKGYKDNYTIADLSYNIISQPAFNPSATYSYAKATIESFSPQSIQTFISSQG